MEASISTLGSHMSASPSEEPNNCGKHERHYAEDRAPSACAIQKSREVPSSNQGSDYCCSPIENISKALFRLGAHRWGLHVSSRIGQMRVAPELITPSFTEWMRHFASASRGREAGTHGSRVNYSTSDDKRLVIGCKRPGSGPTPSRAACKCAGTIGPLTA